MSKKCTRCEIDKELDEFYKHPKTRDGRQSQCSECNKELNRLKTAENPGRATRRVSEWRRKQYGQANN